MEANAVMLTESTCVARCELNFSNGFIWVAFYIKSNYELERMYI